MGITEKHRKNGDYINHYYHTPGSLCIGFVQTIKGQEVYEDYLTYDNPEEAQEAFNEL